MATETAKDQHKDVAKDRSTKNKEATKGRATERPILKYVQVSERRGVLWSMSMQVEVHTETAQEDVCATAVSQ